MIAAICGIVGFVLMMGLACFFGVKAPEACDCY
jgi:hypothetical protein